MDESNSILYMNISVNIYINVHLEKHDDAVCHDTSSLYLDAYRSTIKIIIPGQDRTRRSHKVRSCFFLFLILLIPSLVASWMMG